MKSSKYCNIKNLFFILFIVSILLFSYSFFIERFLIKIEKTEINANFDLNIALISDLHLGKWKGEDFLLKVVKEINNLDIEAVFIAGDFTYNITNTDSFDKIFEPLKYLQVPVYAVLGNHDEEKPGPPLSKELKKTLRKYNVKIIENSVIKLKNKISLIGLGDRWAKNDDLKVLENINNKDLEKSIILTHNPDTVLNYNHINSDKFITLTGHTHGGQIRIPFIYKFVIPCIGDFDKGMHETKNGRVFISSGLGEVGLPLRFFNPPQVDLLIFRNNN
jgi:predicted MPP superfamily phosphohydrolase